MCVRLVLRFLSCWFGIWLILRTLVAQRLKRLPGKWNTRVRSLGREDPLEKEMAPHSNTLAWRIPWREEPGRLQSMGSQSRTRLRDFTFTFTLGLTTSPGLPSQLSWKRIHLQCRRPQFNSGVEKIHWRRDRLPTPVFLGFPFWLSWQRICLQCGRLGKGYPLQYSGLENSMDCILQSMGVTKSWAPLSDFHFHQSAFTFQNSVAISFSVFLHLVYSHHQDNSFIVLPVAFERQHILLI